MKRAWIGIALGVCLAVGAFSQTATARDVEERVGDRSERRDDVGDIVDENVEQRQDRRDEVEGVVDENIERRQGRRDEVRDALE
jgi:hypothetical protein